MIIIDTPCEICSNPKSNTKFSILQGSRKNYYCSENCRKKGTAIERIVLAIVAITFISILVLINYNPKASFWWTLVYTSIFVSPFLFMIHSENIIIKTPIPTWSVKDTSDQNIPEFKRIADSLHPRDNLAKFKEGKEYISQHVERIYISEIDKKVLVCCYQSARFGKDNYCMCGRTITLKFKQIFIS